MLGVTGLPAGLTFESALSAIIGIPTGQALPTPVQLTASNAGGTTTATLLLNVPTPTPTATPIPTPTPPPPPPPPVIDSILFASTNVNQSFTYQITAINSPTSFNAIGLPAGLTVDPGTGLISGRPSTAGTFLVSLSATNAGGTGSATLTLDVSPAGTPGAPVITSGMSAITLEGQPFFYQITATNAPTSYDATGLPAGLTVDTGTGLISGTPFVSGTFAINLSATNTAGTGTALLTLVVVGAIPPPPDITSPSSATATVGESFSYLITATNTPSSYDATGLPAGLTVDTGTGLISGTPFVSGTFAINLSATNTAGTTSAILTLTVQPASSQTHPIIISSTSATGRVSQPFNFQVITSGGDSSTRLYTNDLPAGLTADAVTGRISGIVTSEGSFSVTLTAIGGTTSSASLQLTFTSDPARPVIVSDIQAALTIGQPFSYTIMAPTSDSPGSISYFYVGTLPPGLGFDSTTGTISGTFQSRPDNMPSPQLAGGVITNVQLFAINSSGIGTIPLVGTLPLVFFLAPSEAADVSTRLEVGTNDDVLIGGFIVTGNAPKRALIRALGPSLTGTTPPTTGALADPVLELHSPDGTFVTNDNWRDKQEVEIEATGIPPMNDLESALIANLAPLDPMVSGSGLYTVVVRGKSGSTGVGLVEVYDLGTASLDISSHSQLANISTRGKVQMGDKAMIGGFIVGGSTAADILVRAIGPELTTRGVAGALENTTLELFDNNANPVAFNDDWETDQEAEILFTNAAPIDSRESAILLTLSPGNYTAIVRGKNNTTGVALVEAYVMP